MELSRRRFLWLVAGGAGTAAVTGVAIGSGGDAENAMPAGAPSPTPTLSPTPVRSAPPAPSPTVPPGGDRVLVVVQLGGGNDGLNTLVPLGDGRYVDARPGLAIADRALALEGRTDLGLHPSLGGLASLWADDDLAAIQGIGLPDQSRSHFVALDTWWAGSADAVGDGGWLGRWMDATASTSTSPLRAVSLGGASPALVGATTAPVTLQTPDTFRLVQADDTMAAADAFAAIGVGTPADGVLGRAQAAIPTAVHAVDALQDAFDRVDDPAATYTAPGVADLFTAAGDIVEADLGTQVVVVNVQGFDTHANQLSVHETLLAAVGEGIAGLFARLRTSGNDDRTLLMAYSEFGRRVAENGSGGTDHGAGGLALLAGPGVRGRSIVGEVDLGDLDEGDVRIGVDARSLYANAIDWLGGPSEEILGGEWDTYDLVVA